MTGETVSETFVSSTTEGVASVVEVQRRGLDVVKVCVSGLDEDRPGGVLKLSCARAQQLLAALARWNSVHTSR